MELSALSSIGSSSSTTANLSLQQQLQAKEAELRRLQASKGTDSTRAAKERQLEAEIEEIKAKITLQTRTQAAKTASSTTSSASTSALNALV